MDHDLTLRPRRRTVLGGFAAIGAGTMLTGLAGPGLPAHAAESVPADFEAARVRWCALITGAGADVNDPHVRDALSRLDADANAARAGLDGSADRVFTDLPLTDEVAMRTSYTRLATMATAYASSGSALHQDQVLLAEVLAGLRTVHEIIYHPGHDETGNWWHWEIGASRSLMDTCALLHEVLPAEDLADYVATIDYFVPDPFYQFLDPDRHQESTGANRIDLCRAVLVRGLVGEDAERVMRARDGLSDVFVYVTSGDGIYRDGSFIQHSFVPYTGSYGQVLVDGLSRLLVALAGSPWPVVDPHVQIIFDAVDQGFVPVIHDGRIMDDVRGRSISRSDQPDNFYGRLVIDAILRLADAVEGTDPETAARWRGHCKGWLERTTAVDVFDEADVPRCTAYTRLLTDAGSEGSPEADGLTVFGSMDRAIHRCGGWAYAISMASTRIAYYECGNGENDQGFHAGDGMTYLYDQDGGQFSDEFWPTVDLYRLPGTTVDSAPLPDRAGGQWGAARPPSATWVGGATLDGYGAVGMHLQGLQSTLEARKSWFCLDGVIVALGAGISGGGDSPVETVVENRNLHADGDAELVVDGRRQPGELDWSTGHEVRWAHLEGVGGYVFPSRTPLQLLREDRTGAWSDINTGGPTDEITRRYLTMWIDHGVQPDGASYAYLVVPGASADETRRLAGRSRGLWRILENSPQVQAVRARELGLLAVNFWGSGSTESQSLPATADAYVNDGQHADTTFGSRTLILVKNVLKPDSGYSREGYLTFDLSTVALEPDELGSATLRLWARVNDAGGDAQDLVVYAVDEMDVDTLTWNTKPALGAELGRVSVDSTFAWRQLELTGEVVDRLRAGEPLSVAVVEPTGDTNGLSVEISSSEHPSNGPTLLVQPEPETTEAADVSTDTPCSVVLQETDGELRIAIADPTHEQDEVRLQVRAPEYRHWDAPANVQVSRARKTFTVTVDVAGSAGATHLLTLTR